ncbi:MAG: hypothetical protein MJ193_04825, partial [Clostridia bacterium]|nr:hypothetical protein [Clostridia bacterium]
MLDLTFEQLNEAKFKLYDGNPVIYSPASSSIIADPSVLTPDNSHDGKWHLFCHTIWGVNHYSSTDGINFKKEGKVLSRAMRPDINYIDGLYFLYYERVQPILIKGLTFLGVK